MRFSLPDIAMPILVGLVAIALALALAFAVADLERGGDRAEAQTAAEALRGDLAALGGRQQADLGRLLGLAPGTLPETLRGEIRSLLATEERLALAVWRTDDTGRTRIGGGGTFRRPGLARSAVARTVPGDGLRLVAPEPGEQRLLYSLSTRTGGFTYTAIAEARVPVVTFAPPPGETGDQIWAGAPGSEAPASAADAHTTLDAGASIVAIVAPAMVGPPSVAIIVGTVGVLLALCLTLTGLAIGQRAEQNAFLRTQNAHLTGKVERSNQLRRESEKDAQTDPLTGLPNRNVIMQSLEKAVARAKRSDEISALFFIDLDGFKAINDHFGHQAGDELLVSVARRLGNAFRGNDTVARFAGDEFCVLCENVVDDGAAACLKIERLLAEPVLYEGNRLDMRASVGMALAGQLSPDPDRVLREADDAMYRAKQSGGGRVEIAVAPQNTER